VRPALDREVALDDQLVALAPQRRGLEGDLRMALRVEEVRGQEVLLEVRLHRDGLDRHLAVQTRLAADLAERAFDGVEAAAEGGYAEVLDAELDRGVDGVDGPRPGGDDLLDD